MRDGAKKRQLARLFATQGGKCHWCGGQMVLIKGHFPHVKDPPNRATLDHLEQRLNPARGTHQFGAVRHVAACWSCNNRRGAEFIKSLPPEVVREQSQH